MLLQVSGRTDICALYPKWFVNRLKAGYILVRNPYNEHQVSHVDVTPEVVDCICFCTKDPKAIVPYLTQIDSMGYNYYFVSSFKPFSKMVYFGLFNYFRQHTLILYQGANVR